jgi:hypothetical protein
MSYRDHVNPNQMPLFDHTPTPEEPPNPYKEIGRRGVKEARFTLENPPKREADDHDPYDDYRDLWHGDEEGDNEGPFI